LNNTDKGIIVSVNIINRNASPITFSVAMSANPAPEEHEWIESGTVVIAGAQFDRTQIFLAPDEYIVACASSNDVYIQVWGIGFGAEAYPPVEITNTVADGSSRLQAAVSASAIKSLTGTSTDGVYWIKASPASPAQEVYCIMDNTWDGGGWMVVANNSASTAVSASGHIPRLTARIEWVGSNGADSYNRTNNFSINVRDWDINELAWCARQPLGTFKDIYTYVYGTFDSPTYIPESTAWTRRFNNFHQTLPWLVVPDLRTRPSYLVDPTGVPASAFSAITSYAGSNGPTSFTQPVGYTPITAIGRYDTSTTYPSSNNDSNTWSIGGLMSFSGNVLAGSGTGTASDTGWDDWQDGNGLSDAWGIAGSVNYGRGYPSYIMVR
jgi:hypothetical protein